MFGESLDDGRIIEDPSNSSIDDNPGTRARSCRFDSPNSSGDRGEGAEMLGTIMGSFNGEGFDGGVSSHGKHGREVVVGKGYILDEVL